MLMHVLSSEIISTLYSGHVPTMGGILGPQVLMGLVQLSREISLSRQVLRNMPGPGTHDRGELILSRVVLSRGYSLFSTVAQSVEK